MEREHALAVWMALLIYPDNPSIKAIDSIVKELVKIGKGLDPIVKLTLKHFKGVNERYSKSMILSYFKLLIGLISYSNEMSELFLKDLVLEICKLGYWILDSHPKVIRMLMERMPTDSVHLAPLNTPSGIVWIAACGFFNDQILDFIQTELLKSKLVISKSVFRLSSRVLGQVSIDGAKKLLEGVDKLLLRQPEVVIENLFGLFSYLNQDTIIAIVPEVLDLMVNPFSSSNEKVKRDAANFAKFLFGYASEEAVQKWIKAIATKALAPEAKVLVYGVLQCGNRKSSVDALIAYSVKESTEVGFIALMLGLVVQFPKVQPNDRQSAVKVLAEGIVGKGHQRKASILALNELQWDCLTLEEAKLIKQSVEAALNAKDLVKNIGNRESIGVDELFVLIDATFHLKISVSLDRFLVDKFVHKTTQIGQKALCGILSRVLDLDIGSIFTWMIMNGDRLVVLDFCKSIRQEILQNASVLERVSELFLNGVYSVLSQEKLETSIWGDQPPRSSQYCSTRIVNALFQMLPSDMNDSDLIKRVLMDWFVVCAHPSMVVNQGDDLWIRLVFKVGMSPSVLEEYLSYVDSWLLLENHSYKGGLSSTGGFREATVKSIRLAYEISPKLVLERILRFATSIIEDEEFTKVSPTDILIWSTPEDQVCFDPLVKSETKSKGMNKDQKWELEMKKELEKKGAVKRTKQELELLEKQLKKEKEIRVVVQDLKIRLDAAMDVLYEVIDISMGHAECKPVLQDFVAEMIDLLLYGIIQRECVTISNGRDVEAVGAVSNGRAIMLFTKLLEIYLKDSLNPVLVANTTLSAFGVEESWIEERYNQPVEKLVKKVVDQLYHEEELQTLEPIGITVLFPLLKLVLMKEGRLPLIKEKQHTEVVMSCSDVLLAHVGFESALYLPRQEMVDCLLHLIQEYPRLRVAGRDGLLALSVALSHFTIENDSKEAEIVDVITDTLLNGILAEEAAVRSTCIAALGHIPLVDDLDKYNAILWIARFDQDDNTQVEAQELWSELYDDEVIEKSLIPTLLTFVIHQNKATRSSAGKAICSALESEPDSLKQTLDTLFDYYAEYIKDPVPELDDYGMVKPESLNRPDPFEQRSGVAMALKSCVPVISEKEDVMQVFKFLIEQNALGDRNETVRQEMLQAGLELLEQQAKPFIKVLLDLFDKTLSSLSSDEDNLREAIVILMGSLARYLEPTDKRIVETVIKLIDTLKTPSESVQIAVAECLPALVKINKDHVGGRIKELLDMLFTSEKYGHRRGAAYGLAGIVKGTGVASLKDHLIMAHLKEAVEDKRNIQKREGALFAFETLSYMLGRMFEPYVIQILPLLLVCYGDSNKNIRDATEDTCRVIMSKLSAHCVKLLLPSLLNGLQERSFKTKVGAIEIMASMSALAPKQLGQSLPTIVPKICEALSDSHQKVQEAAREALEQFGKVIKNPEIQGLVPVLIAALVNPNHKTLPALAELLDTTFVHYIDAPSLALLVPIIHRGLKERSAETKKKAAQIMGNMSSLTEPGDLTPYLEILVPPLKEVLVDPVPEARATAAKAFGSMIAKLGEDKFEGLVDELLETLESDTSGVDRSGAAQGLSEVLAGIGLPRLEGLLPHFINQANSVKPFAREGFTTLLVYLPHTFGERFGPYISKIVPTMLEGLADEIETVREAALHLGQVIVRNYFKSAVSLVLPELEKGLFNDNWRIRQNSVQLIGDLIFKIAGISQQVSADENDEMEGFGSEQHRVALKAALGDRYDNILASLYIVRSDSSGLVRNTALGVWKAIVANTPRTLKQILPALMNILLSGLASNSYEKRTVAARTLGDLVRRLGDNVLNLIIPILQDGLDSDEEDTREGVCIGLCEVMSSGGKLLESDFLFQCTPLVRKALVDESSEVRSSAAQAFDILHQLIGPKAIDEIIPDLLASLKKQSNPFALEGLKEIMNVRSNAVFPVLIPTLLTKPITSSNAQALGTLISVAGSALTKRLDVIIPALMDELEHESEASEDILSALEAIMTSVEGDGLYKVTSILTDILYEGSLNQKVTACKCLCLFFTGSDEEVDGYISDFITIMTSYLSDPSPLLVKESWNALDVIVKRIRKDDMHRYVSSVRKGIRSAEQNLNYGEEIAGFNLTKGLTPIVTILLQGLMTGEIDTREASAYGLGDVINRTSEVSLKPFVTQITGPLIRVIGDRFPAVVKTAILSCLGLLLSKVPAMLKPFLPQLQRTFVKSLSETGSTPAMRNKTAQCLSLLIPLQARLDPLVMELVQGIKQADAQVKKAIWEALFGLLQGVSRDSGKSLNESSHANIESLLLEAALESGEYDASERLGAAKCFGSYCQVLSIENAQSLVMNLSEDIGSKEWVKVQGVLMCLENVVRFALPIIDDSLQSRFVEVTVFGLKSTKTPLIETAIQVALELIDKSLHSQELIETLIQVSQTSTESTDARRDAITCIKNLAKRNHKDILSLMPKAVPVLMTGVRDRTIPVKLAAERALVYVLQIKKGTAVLDTFLKTLDNAQARSIGDYAKRVLTKIGERDSDQEDEE